MKFLRKFLYSLYKFLVFLTGSRISGIRDPCKKVVMFFGRKIRITRSQISRRALTTQQANVHRVKVVVDGTPKSMNVCTRCLRSGKVERA